MLAPRMLLAWAGHKRGLTGREELRISNEATGFVCWAAPRRTQRYAWPSWARYFVPGKSSAPALTARTRRREAFVPTGTKAHDPDAAKRGLGPQDALAPGPSCATAPALLPRATAQLIRMRVAGKVASAVAMARLAALTARGRHSHLAPPGYPRA